ncbi:MAG: bacteriocin-protection protein [Phenylobacterium sp.]|uniref:YdeI/OmpD-associated family protein n=1 Tax=Phenylobacterium sp. TaxID=1871053 RepID=UPI0025F53ED1|nr:YdeI/OmpD-associated family protein [Phenylobacterium sp.]MBA4012599.1 bacteriocin-protection protein [Phenylobacterium sp.]
MAPTFFETPQAFRAWLEANHQTAAELSVGFRKTGTGLASITWPEAVDQALCFGWIDGVRHSIDAESYRIRFTPRRPNGIWSQVNIRRMAELQALGLVHPAGLAAFEAGKGRTNEYSHERGVQLFSDAETAQFQANAPAWANFQAFPPSYRKVAVHRVVSAKGAETRAKRMLILIDACRDGVKLVSATKREAP